MRTTSSIQMALLVSLTGAVACLTPAVAQAGEPVLAQAAPSTPAAPPPDAAPPVETDSVTILSPAAGVQAERSTTLVVQYPSGTQIRVQVNGQPIAADAPTQIQPNPASNQVTQVWYNLPLTVGENVLTVQPEGGTAVTRTVTVRETAARLLFLPATNPRIPANGRSTLTLEGQVVDAQGEPIQRDAVVTLTASAGVFVGADQDSDRPGFQVLARGGKFTAQLQSTLQPQKVRVRAAVDLQEPKPVRFPLSSAPAENVTSSTTQAPAGSGTPVPSITVQSNSASTTDIVKVPPLLNPAIGEGALLQRTTNSLARTNAVSELEAYTQVEFITDLRQPIVSGTVNIRLGTSGTDFYGSFRDFLAPDRLDEDVRFDVATALFATGRVGDWLVTAAFNNQRPLNQTCDGTTRLFRDPQFCDQVYPVYGDSSTTDYLAPSIDSLYFKIERTSPIFGAGSDFAMWGDYSTSEFANPSQFFTATNRQLHGFKGNFNLGNLQITGLFANNLEGFQRDTIAPNGTSGYYFLSRRLLVPGSEVVAIEAEELGRPGTVVTRKQLTRTVDYEIDYDRGALLFRRPLLQTEFDLFGRTLVRRIVITYQFDGIGTDDTSLYAGRLQYNFAREFGQESWIGATYLNEEQGSRYFELYGADIWFPLGKEGRLVAEVGRSRSNSLFFGDIEGTAYRVEAFGNLLPGVVGRAYYRTVSENFANNATFSFSPGQTRLGAEVSAAVGPTTQLQFQADYEENFGIASSTLTGFFSLFVPLSEAIPGSRINNEVTTLRAGVVQRLGTAEVSLDVINRDRRDRITELLNEDATQIVSRLNLPITERLVFRAQNEQNLGSSDPLYPDRTTFGLDWVVFPGLTLRAAQQFLEETSVIKATSLTTVDAIFDQKLSDDTAMTARYSVLGGLNGWTGQGAIGLNHRIRLAPGLRMNLAYERIFGNIFAYTVAGQQSPQAYAPGQSSASLGVTEGDSYSVGVEYTDNPSFKASGRFEYRNAGDYDSMLISAAAAGKISPALTLLGRYQQANFANQLINQTELGDTINLKVGLAYRDPASDKLNLLLRYEFRQNPSTIPNDITFTTGTGSTEHLLSLETIYAPNWRWEFYGKFALRDTKSYLAKDLIGANSITLTQFRAAYRFAYRWDAAAEVRWISQSLFGFDEVGFVTEVGYYLTPSLRVAAGYNFGRTDRDFGDRDRDGFFINLSLKVNELFNGFGLQPVVPPQQQESKVPPLANQPIPQAAQPTAAAPASGEAVTEQTTGGQKP